MEGQIAQSSLHSSPLQFPSLIQHGRSDTVTGAAQEPLADPSWDYIRLGFGHFTLASLSLTLKS